MPFEFCCACGDSHDTADSCKGKKKATEVGRTTRSSTAKMAKSGLTDGVAEIEALNKMSLEELRRDTMREIDELRLEDEVRCLQEERDRLLSLREKRKIGQRKEITDSLGHQDAGAVKIIKEKSGKEPATEHQDTVLESGYSTYGRSRRRSRDGRRRCRSASSSSSTSAERKLRSKWSLKRFLETKKDVKKLNCHEIVCATAAWALEIPIMSLKDHRALLEHIYFISHRARSGEYLDSAHADYDLGIRKLAEKKGFEAFSSANTGKSVLHYGHEGSRKQKTTSTGYSDRKRGVRGGRQNTACYAYNSEQGCLRKEGDCRYDHKCSKCGGRGHKRVTCKD